MTHDTFGGMIMTHDIKKRTFLFLMVKLYLNSMNVDFFINWKPTGEQIEPKLQIALQNRGPEEPLFNLFFIL